MPSGGIPAIASTLGADVGMDVHDEVVGPEGRQHEEVHGRVLVGECEVDLLGPDAEAGLAVEGDGAVWYVWVTRSVDWIGGGYR